jgi:hypothetical protein
MRWSWLAAIVLSGCLGRLGGRPDTDRDTDSASETDTDDPDSDDTDTDTDTVDDVDADGVVDGLDECPDGDRGWVSDPTTDHDGDGCQDAVEDTDDDGDTVPDAIDACDVSPPAWTSDPASDRDGDGCRDADEDDDADDDGVPDASDHCPHGDVGWTAASDTDHDADGCQDAGEDPNDDEDSFLDGDDDCPRGTLGWVFDDGGDDDVDGCLDDDEDDDDDNDNVIDALDGCDVPLAGFWSSPADDLDADGCRDGDQDPDDDGDGSPDVADCAPTDSHTYPGAPERCDAVDNDCAGDTHPIDVTQPYVYLVAGADPNGAGTREDPVGSLDRALDLAAAGAARVVASSGRFVGRVTFDTGSIIEVSGGYDPCDWEPTRAAPTVVTHDDTFGAVITATGFLQRLFLDHVDIETGTSCADACEALTVGAQGRVVFSDGEIRCTDSAAGTARCVDVSQAGLDLERARVVAAGSARSNPIRFSHLDGGALRVTDSEIVALPSPEATGIRVIDGRLDLVRSTVVATATSGAARGVDATPSTRADVSLFGSDVDVGGTTDVVGLRVTGPTNTLVVGSTVSASGDDGVAAVTYATSVGINRHASVNALYVGVGPGARAIRLDPVSALYPGLVLEGVDLFAPVPVGTASATLAADPVTLAACSWGNCGAIRSVLFADPKLDAGRLAADSPCIDAGVDPTAYDPDDHLAIDLDGDPRPSPILNATTPWDLGADERPTP